MKLVEFVIQDEIEKLNHIHIENISDEVLNNLLNKLDKTKNKKEFEFVQKLLLNKKRLEIIDKGIDFLDEEVDSNDN